MSVGVYTVSEIAKILRVSTKTVYKLIREQELPHIRVRGQIRITDTVLNQYLQRGDCNEETTSSEFVREE